MLTKISVTYLTVVSKYHTLAVLNLAVWPQTDRKKIHVLVEFKFDGSTSGLFIKERCCLSLEAHEQSHEFAIYKK